MLDRSEEAILLERIKLGEESAYQRLFQEQYKKLCYVAYRVYADEHKAKDFAQEVFLDLWRRRETLDVHYSIGAYLRRAVTNKAIDYIRSQRLNFSEDPILPNEHQADDSGKVEQKELQGVIDEVVAGLPERCRVVFAMSRYEQLSHKEIASRLEISEKTIENQITKALKRLRLAVSRYQEGISLLLLIFAW